MSSLKKRRSARLVILDPHGRLLLFRYRDEHQPVFWSTAGGELVGGEGYRSAAERELQEETGFECAVGPLLYEREDVYAVSRSVPAHWCERYFLVNCDSTRSPSRNGWSEEERCTIQDWQWWSVREMLNGGENFLPSWLPALLNSVLIEYRDAKAVVR